MNGLFNLARFFSTHPLARSAPMKAWVRFAIWQIRSRFHNEVLHPWIANQSLAIRRGMTGATGNIYVGLHEFADMMVLLHFLRKGDLFLDIGANVGSYTVLDSGVCRALTWAFEPDPDTVKHLQRNIALNHLDELVTIYECALGSTRCEVRFTVGLDTVNRVMVASHDANVRTVRQERLDSIIGTLSDPIMMKIDVEGYETEVLQGALATLSRSSLKVIELETVTPCIIDILNHYQFYRAYYDHFNRYIAK